MGELTDHKHQQHTMTLSVKNQVTVTLQTHAMLRQNNIGITISQVTKLFL